ncbi:hypothetical protein QR680_014974 [Steinernema hermaphroditum]|uniref:RlpA-like protein double-psi beta-barrel domain-containing protein n=1 Tax=Steinernema hermaphroditum TaxID=289476 RepID=A0AA39IC46_9BILA|nr:hypothetical protein QR680_014974 [Steinernema hermaphroditum]
MLRFFLLFSFLLSSTYGGEVTFGKPIKGHFTWFSEIGRGACGSKINANEEKFVAAPGYYWKSGNFSHDPICHHVCVEIRYKGHTLSVPVKDQCATCHKNHFDLSIPAFKSLEPVLDFVDAKNAVFIFKRCYLKDD